MPDERLQPLEGTQEIIVRENGDCVAILTAMAVPHLRGAHVSLACGESVDRLALGCAIHDFAIICLHMENYLSEDRMRDLKEQLHKHLRQHEMDLGGKDASTIPF